MICTSYSLPLTSNLQNASAVQRKGRVGEGFLQNIHMFLRFDA